MISGSSFKQEQASHLKQLGLAPLEQPESSGSRVASIFLEGPFHGQKAASKRLNDALFATLCC
jgi:hypothetical protein